jgi:hypothetical protein
MSARRLLVVATAPVEASELRECLRDHADPDAEVRVVAPASNISALQWLANDEDDARDEAAEIAGRAEQAAEPVAARVEVEIGDSDPVRAIEDALRSFPAGEILVVTHRGDDANWLEQDTAAEASERFGVPVTQLVVGRG